MEGKKKRIRKIISTIVAAALIVTMLPAADYAYGETIVPAESSDATYVDSIDPMSEGGVTEEQFFAIEAEWKADQKRRKLHRATLSGSGTVSDPYLIYTAADLQSMVDNDHSCYKLMRDIDLKGRNWRPPGYYYWYPFMGYLDGNGHKVTNLFVGGTQDDAWNINAGGFFGFLEGRVENLGVETVKAKRKGIDFFGTAGGIAGVANAPAEIINCYFNGYVAGSSYVGGLVGIAYPGTVIENCCALGTVDMSQAYEYLNDNDMKWVQDIFNATMDTAIYGALVTGNAAEGFESYGPIGAVVEGVGTFFLKMPELLKDITSTDYLSGIRKCSIGGLAGLNYGWIYNSYAANELYNVKTTMASTTKMGGIVARNVEDCSEAQIVNCFYNKDLTDHDGGFEDYGRTTAQLKSQSSSGLDSEPDTAKQWNYSAKTLSKKSTDGYPLPKTPKVKRSKRVDKKTGIVYEPAIYYQSRVLMRTRADFAIGTPHTSQNGIESTKCTICADLKNKGKTDDNHYAVTGIYQRGTKSMPYHVHDIDSMLGLQDKKEFNYLLCNDIDFKVSDHEGNTVQKYWWPVGKTHFSPSKGYFKGNTTMHEKHKVNGKSVWNKINDNKKPRKVEKQEDVFAIKNLTVQTNRLAGLFATLRGTFSDINVELASGQKWNNWKDGIRGSDGNTVGISSMGNVSSAGGVAGDVVTGGVIRNCQVGGPGFASFDGSKTTVLGSGAGYVSSSLRGGGVVGFLDRGAKIYNVTTYVAVDPKNYDLHYVEDQWGIGIKLAEAIGNTAYNLADFATNTIEFTRLMSQIKTTKSYKNLDKSTQNLISDVDDKLDLSKVNPQKYSWQAAQSVLSTFMQKLFSIFEPLLKLWVDEYAIVCNGYLVGENYGNVDDCLVYLVEGIDRPWWNMHMNGDVIGYQGFENEAHYEKKAMDQIASGAASPASFNMMQFKLDLYKQEHNIQVKTLAAAKKGISGKGTEEEPIKVATEDDLQKIAALLNEGYDFEGVYIEQIDDIKMTESFECMGLSSQTPFKGVYNGNECVIEGLRIENNSSASLFYKLDGALVYNLTIEDGYFNGAQAAALAKEAVNETLILNCGSSSVVMAKKDKVHERNSKAAGLIVELHDSYIGNSYVKDTVRAEFAAAGIAYTIDGTSELANCYVGAGLYGKAENYRAGIGIEVAAQDDCCMYNCYWPDDYNAVGPLSGWSIEHNNRSYSRDDMKSQSFVNVLNSADNNTINDNCYIDMSENRDWVVTEAGYPEFKVNYCSLKVIQPAQGKIKAEYARNFNGSTTWHEVDTIRLPKGAQIRLTLQSLPGNKAFDYWKINGSQNHHGTSQYIGYLQENSVFEVALKNVVSLGEQTRELRVKIPEHGKLTLKISDVFENEESAEPVPSRTVVMEGNKLYVDRNTVPVDEKSDDLAYIYSDPMLTISSQIKAKGEYVLTIPYGAKIEPVYTDSTQSYWLREFIINDSQIDEKESGKFEYHITENSNMHVVITQTKPEDNSDEDEVQSNPLPN